MSILVPMDTIQSKDKRGGKRKRTVCRCCCCLPISIDLNRESILTDTNDVTLTLKTIPIEVVLLFLPRDFLLSLEKFENQRLILTLFPRMSPLGCIRTLYQTPKLGTRLPLFQVASSSTTAKGGEKQFLSCSIVSRFKPATNNPI